MSAGSTEGSPPVHESSGDLNDKDQCVVVIDSDSEDDELVFEENRLRSLAPDVSVNRRRHPINQSLSDNGTNPIVHRASGNHSGDPYIANYDQSDEDLAIVREAGRQIDSEETVNSGAEYIDLEEGPAYSTDDRNSVQHTGNALRDNNASAGQSSDETNIEDDGLMIVQERTMVPTIRLGLPGGEFVEIRASPYDAPSRRSFERQQSNYQLPLRRSRRQLRRRAGRRPRQSLFQSEEDYEAEAGFPPTVPLRRRPEQLSRQQTDMRQRERQLQLLHGSRNDPIMAELQRRVDSFPPNVRSAFDYAESVGELRSILQRSAPLTWQECNDELQQLYVAYRDRLTSRMVTERLIASQDQAQLHRPQSINGSGLPHVGIGDGVGESLTHYLLQHDNYGNGHYAMMMYSEGAHDDIDEEARTQSLMNMIQEREERERDIRTKKFMEKSKPQEEAFLIKSKSLPEGYSASFDTKPMVRVDIVKNGEEQSVMVEDDSLKDYWEEVPVCCLCGVELGVGIPEDFEGLVKKDRDLSFEVLVAKYNSHCPYQSLARPTATDRDLSKKTFIASCGHTFCGRCVVRIDNARSRSKSKVSKRKLAELKGSSHPDNYGPKTCPGAGCKLSIRSPKVKMREAFF